MMNVFLLLAQELRRDVVQAVRAEFMVAEHVGKHVEHDPPGNTCLHVLTFTVGAALKGCVPSRGAETNHVERLD